MFLYKVLQSLRILILNNIRESENKTIRFPLPLVEKIEDAIKNNDVTFSSFVIQACEYALQNMEM